MARPIISVSKASDEHAGELSALWIESALSSGMSHELAARVANAARIQEALARAGTTVLLARSDGSLVGFAVVNTRNHGLLEPAALAIDELYVAAAARRQGVGSHVLAAVARVAESEGHELVFANVAATDKLSNRYFARLGFRGRERDGDSMPDAGALVTRVERGSAADRAGGGAMTSWRSCASTTPP